MGKRRKISIELLYFDGCPGAARALDAIRRVVAETGLEAEVVPVEGVGPETHPGFSGSPTLLVNGEDLFPAGRADALSCRLYETPEGIRNAPTDAMLRTEIERRDGV